MGQTLTHGIYLPDEGERNCYNGLAGNWTILDGAVGTVAEHTSQIAGKAPAVHTHTKSDITDFPALANVATSGSYNDLSNIPASFTPSSHTHGNLTNDGKVGTTANVPLITGTDGVVQAGSFGTSANTFCEGNDSRLSDARTPVAHTHVTADITDLLNSNFIPSANNSYDLGSSSYQWNNLYAKNYYYNGTAWGLDKANVWSDNQTVLKNSEALYALKRSNLKLGDPIPQTTQVLGTFAFTGSDGANAGIITFRDSSNGDTSLIILARQRYNSNGNRDPDGFQYETRLDIGIDSSRNRYIRPNSNSDIDLGTSTNKWKTLNGVNPGALSLPKTDASVTAINTSGFSFNGSDERVPDTVNLFFGGEALVDGWLCARLAEGIGHYIFLNSDSNTNKTGIIASCFSSGIVSSLVFGLNVYVPVKVGDKPVIRWAKPNGGNAQLNFYPCFGNV